MKTTMHTSSLRPILATSILALLSATALAQTWTGGGNGVSWNQAANWSVLPVSNPGTFLSFANAAAITTNQNLGSPFQLFYIQHSGAGALTINGSALEFFGSAGTIQSTAGATITVNAPLISSQFFHSLAANTTFNGPISGVGSFEAWAGITTITGAGTWSGGTQVVATLRVAAPNALSNNSSLSVSSGLLDFVSPSALSYTGNITGGGILQQSGPGMVSLSGNGSGYSGNVIVAAGTLQASGGTNPLGSGSVTVQSGGTLNIAATTAHNFGGVTVQGGGTLLAGASAGLQFTPVAVQSGGLVQLSANDGLTGAGNSIAVAAGATLNGGGFQQTTPVQIDNAGSVVLPAGSLVTVGNGSTWTGSSTGSARSE